MIAINKIKGRLAEKSLTQGDVAKAWKCATPTVSQKLNGKTDARPQFQKMIADSGKQLFDIVIVYTLDRFARNRYDSERIKQN